jgi:GNAT superfamily N-acetyltransferase
MSETSIEIVQASALDVPEIAKVFKTSFVTMLPYLPILHTAEEDLVYFSEEVFPKNQVFVARADSKVVGFIAFDSAWVNHLYLLPAQTGQGIGLRLLNMAKNESEKLQLWVFQKNEIARKFYSRNGFEIVKLTDGADNEEKEPDVLMEWKRKS